MKYEFVEFYPFHEGDKCPKNCVGTCHIYAYSDEIQIDYRGILVRKLKNGGFLFHFPHFKQIDPEENRKVSYPIIRLADPHHENLLKFMFSKVAPIIRERLNPKMAKSA